MKRNKILYVSTVDMFSNTGGGLATKAFYNAYLNIFQDKLVLMHAKEYYKGDYDKQVVLTKRRKSIYKFLKFLTGHVHRFYPDIIEYLKKHVDEYNECVINGGVYAGDSIEEIKRLGITVTVIHHNFERQYHLDNKTIASFYGKSAFLINHWERKAYLLADNNLFLTNYDLCMFQKYYGFCKGKCYCIGSFMPQTSLGNLTTKIFNKNSINIVISGALDFPQSYNSIIKFYTDYFKPMNMRNIKLLVTGRNPSQQIVEISKNSDVTLVPSPTDICNVINEGDIYLCPIDCGGGIKMRIMDGLKCGKPVIVHKNSIRGYEYFHKKEYFGVYSSVEDFERILSSIIDKLINHRINSLDIQNDYLSYFSLESGTKRLRQFYNMK